MTGINLAVFDCDGTIVDSQHSIIAAMQAAFNALSLDHPSPEAVKRIVGLPLIDAIALLLPSGDSDTHQRIRDEYRSAYSTARERGHINDPLFPGIKKALDDLEASGWILGVATGKSYAGLVNTLQSHGLFERFTTIQTADKAAGKPNPDMMLQAMAETGADPQDTIMIGDTTFDIEMARSAGTLALGVAWGYHHVEELVEAGAGAVAHTCNDIPQTALRLVR